MIGIDIGQVKRYLSQANILSKEVESLQRTLEELESAAGAGATKYDAIRVQSAKDPHAQMDSVAVKAWELMDTIKRRQDKILEIHSVINAIENPLYRVILIEYYLNQKTWEEVWVYLNFSPDGGYVRILQHSAIAAAGRVMEEKDILPD